MLYTRTENKDIVRPMFHIVDDANFLREVMAEILGDFGYKTIAFSSPDEYISHCHSADYVKPIAVFTDVNMPGMNGYDMINAVSSFVPNLKFVVMTGESSIRSEHIDKACMYLNKPFNPDKLIKTVESLIRCHAFSPADDHGCITIDDRKTFPIENWSCPGICKTCSTYCSKPNEC